MSVPYGQSGVRTLDHRLVPYAEWLVEVAREQGWDPNVTSTTRSTAKQTKLYAKFLRGELPYTVAPPGRSLHEHALAWDMTVAPHRAGDATMNDRLRALGELWESVGGTWGGRFRDPIHFDARVLKA